MKEQLTNLAIRLLEKAQRKPMNDQYHWEIALSVEDRLDLLDLISFLNKKN